MDVVLLYKDEDGKKPCWLFKPHQQPVGLLAEFSCSSRPPKFAPRRAELFCPLSARPLARSSGHSCLPSPLTAC